MTYETCYYYAPRYECTSSNQYGIRYKRKMSKKINCAKLSCERTNASDLEDLIVLGHTLNVPVRYDFDTNRAYIEIMSSEVVRSL